VFFHWHCSSKPEQGGEVFLPLFHVRALSAFTDRCGFLLPDSSNFTIRIEGTAENSPPAGTPAFPTATGLFAAPLCRRLLTAREYL